MERKRIPALMECAWPRRFWPLPATPRHWPTGLFTLSQYHCDNRRLKGFMKKIGTIYAAAVLLYLPLNIYQDYFNRPNLLPNLLRGLVFDGTVYHLWHLPAAMLGLAIV